MRFLVVFFVLLISSPVHAWTGHVQSVTDGDTLIVEGIHVRLYGIDAPQFLQPGGKSARDGLNAMVTGKTVTLETMDTDRHGRPVCRVMLGDKVINAEMVRNGWAWVYPMYCKRDECIEWAKLEAQAREAKRGLWSESEPVPPWEWRGRR